MPVSLVQCGMPSPSIVPGRTVRIGVIRTEVSEFHDGSNIDLLLDVIPLPDIIGMLMSFDVRDCRPDPRQTEYSAA